MKNELKERYINQEEVIQRTGLSANTLRNLEAQGAFPKRTRLAARAVRWWLPDVMRWLENPQGWKVGG